MDPANSNTFRQNAVQERLILEAANEFAIFTTDLHRRITSWNTGAENLFGYAEADMLGQLGDLIYVPEDREPVNGYPNVPQRELEKALADGRADNERWHVRRDGSRLYGSGVVTPLRDEAGTVIGLLKVVRDLTRQKQAEDVLRVSETRQAFLVELGDAMRHLTSPAHIEGALTRVTMAHFAADRCYYCQITNGQATIHRDALREGLPSVAGVYPLASFPLLTAAIESGRPFVVQNVHTASIIDDELRQLCISLQVISFLNIPVIKEGQAVGELCIVQSEPRDWNDVEVSLAEETAERIWAAVERARAEEALARSEDIYRTLFETVDEGFVIGEAFRTDDGLIDFRYEAGNPAWEQIIGLRAADVAGGTARAFLPGLEATWYETVGRVGFGRESINAEEFAAPLGKWLDTTFSPIGLTGESRISVLVRDVTDRKRREANLAFLAEVSQDLVRLISTDETMDTLNAKIGRYFNVARVIFAEISDDQQTGRVSHEWQRPTLPTMNGSYTVKDYFSPSFERLHRAGDMAVVGNTATDGRVDAGRYAALGVGAFVGVPLIRHHKWRFYFSLLDTEPRDWRDDEIDLLRELTTRIWIRLERAHIDEALRDANRRKDEFLALLAHELRNPLATLSNTLLILQLTGGGNENMDLPMATAMMTREVAQLVRLVDDLLDISRISRGKLTLTLAELDLADLVQQAVAAQQTQFQTADRTLTLRLPDGGTRHTPLLVKGDAARLKQVVSNLLTNALKFTHPGGKVSLSLAVAGGEAVVQVHDDGIGIPPHELSRIFEMFAQVDSALGRSQGGLGLGLTLANELVGLHGGRLEAHSAGAGQGSTFTVYLPIEPSPEPADQTDTAGLSAPGTQRRVLVVDDNADAATTLAMLLRLTGNEVHTRFNGASGVEAADSLRPQVVVLDISMPGMDGYQACQRIREHPWGKAMTLIALSGYGQEDDKRRSREAGFDAHLVKPVDLAALNSLLSAL